MPTSERLHPAVRRADLFDEVAEQYASARPTYPDALIDDLVVLAGLKKTHRVLEIGAGTGQLTVALARRGFQITALERGANLARVLTQNTSPFPQVSTVVADFDRWDSQREQFDVVVVATAFHWFDAATRVAKCAGLLRPGGALAIVDTRWGAGTRGDRFVEESQACYSRWEAAHDPNFRPPGPDVAPEFSDELEGSSLFEAITHRRHFCRREYDARDYCALIATFSNILALDAASRSGLLTCIRELIERRFDGRVVRADLHDLWVARAPLAGDLGLPPIQI